MIRLIIVILVAFVCSSCFEFDELESSELNNISIPDSPPIVNFFTEEDTLLLYGHAQLDLRMQDSRTIYGYELYVQNDLILQREGRPEIVSINTYNLENGIQPIILVVYFKTNSNSIADNLQSEAYTISYGKYVKIDNTSKIQTPVITEFKVENGELVIYFEKYNSSYGFETWELTDKDGAILVKSADSTINKIVIPNYYGQKLILYLTLKAKQQVNTSERTSYLWDYDFTLDDSSGFIKLSWNKPTFNNFKHLHIYFTGSGEGISEDVESSFLMTNAPATFPYIYNARVTAVDKWDNTSNVIDLQPRTQRVSLDLVSDFQDDGYYTFRNDSILSFFRQSNEWSEPQRFTLKNCIVYTDRLFLYTDSVKVINSLEGIVFSKDFSQIAQVQSTNFSFVDPLTLGVVETYFYDDYLQSPDVTQVYLSGTEEVAFLHNGKQTVTVVNIKTKEVLKEFSFGCENEYRKDYYYDFSKGNIFVSKSYNGPSIYFGVQGDSLICSDDFDEGVIILLEDEYKIKLALESEGFYSNTYSTTINLYNLKDKLISDKSISLTYMNYPLISADHVFLKDEKNNCNIYSASRYLSLIKSIPMDDENYLSQPQYKNGRFSTYKDGILRFIDLD